MNKIYRLIWNAAVGQWMPVSELSKARGKRGRGMVLLAAAALCGGVQAQTYSEALPEEDAAEELTLERQWARHFAFTPLGAPFQAQPPQTLAEPDYVVIGRGAIAYTNRGIAIGWNAVAGKFPGVNAYAVALGASSTAEGAASTALGYNAQALGHDAVAVGASSRAEGTASTALGQNAKALSNSDTAVGTGSTASGDNSTALGAGATASGYNSASLGRDSVASHSGSVAIGSGSRTYANNTVSVGSTTLQRRITHLANGVDATDAVTVQQLNSTAASKYLAVSTTMAAAKATGTYSALALGAHADSSGKSAMALGYRAKSDHDDSVALGSGSVTSAANTVSVGNTSLTRRITHLADGVADSDAVTLKQLKESTGGDFTELAKTVAGHTVDLGKHDTRISALEDAGGASKYLAVGNAPDGSAATADGGFAVAVGDSAVARRDATAVGTLATAVESGTAVGRGSSVLAQNSVAIGAHSLANEADTVSVGNTWLHRRVSNMAAGTNDTDGVNVSQLKATNANVVTLSDKLTKVVEPTLLTHGADIETLKQAGQFMARVFAVNDLAGADAAHALAAGDVAIGAGARASGQLNFKEVDGRATAIGTGSSAGAGALAAGAFSKAGEASVALGNDAHADVVATAIGAGASAAAESVAVGFLAKATESQAFAMGTYAEANGQGALALGSDARADARDAVAIGYVAKATATNAVAIGKSSVADVADTVSFGSETMQRRLMWVADGTIGAGSKDAVNGGQLYALRNDLEKRIGDVDERVDGLASVNSLRADAPAATAEADSPAPAPAPVQNVAAGTAPTDAVNVEQMHAQRDEGIKTANAYTDGRVDALRSEFDGLRSDIDSRFQQVDRRIDRMAATSGAYAGMAMNTAGLEGKHRMGVGVGQQRGARAIAVGYQRVFGGRASVSLGGASSGNDRSVNAGAGFSW